MPILDPKSELIVAEYCSNGGDQTAAWRIGNPNSKASKKTQHEEASKLFRQPKVRTRILEVHAAVAAASEQAAGLTVEQHLEKLRQLRDEARERGQYSAAITAEKLRGEVNRFYVKQVETGAAGEFARMTDDELRAFIEQPIEVTHGGGTTKH